MDLPQTYTIQTPRLIIRCYTPDDAPKMQKAITESLSHLRPWLIWAGEKSCELDWCARFIRQFRGQFDLGQDAVYGIFNRDETIQLGGTGLHNRIGKDAREIGYWIHAHYLQQGYATETVTALLKIGFRIEKLQRIEIHCAPENTPSRSIPEKLGFKHISTGKNQITDGEGRLRDRMIFSLSAEEYENSQLTSLPVQAFDFLGRELILT